VSGTTVDFYGSGTDNVGTTQAQFFVDGVLAWTDINASGDYHFGGNHNLFDTTVLANGLHVLRMTVSDGTLTASHQIVVDVQNGTTGGGSSGDDGCGALGVEVLLLLALRRRRR
jgi:MYXO-CTERM domain-containing protein